MKQKDLTHSAFIKAIPKNKNKDSEERNAKCCNTHMEVVSEFLSIHAEALVQIDCAVDRRTEQGDAQEEELTGVASCGKEKCRCENRSAATRP